MLNDILEGLSHAAEETNNIGEKTLLTIGLILFAIVVIKLVRRFLHKVMPNERSYYVTQRTVGWIIVVATVVGIGFIWFKALNILLIGTGALIALLALAMKDLVLNLVGFGFIEFRKPFGIGDRVQIKDYYGEVKDVHLFHFVLMEVQGSDRLGTKSQTGRQMFVPNRMVFEAPVINDTFDYGLVWTDLVLPISHDSNLGKAKPILRLAAKRYTETLLANLEDDEDLQRFKENQEMFEGDDDTTAITTSVDSVGIELTLRYLCHHDEIAGSKTKLWEDIHSRIQAVDDIAYSVTEYRILQANSGE